MFNWLSLDILTLFLQGLKLTLILTLITSLLAMAIGIIIGSIRLSSKLWARTGALIFTETFRNIPALVLIIFFAFAVPNLFEGEIRRGLFFNNPFINTIGHLFNLSIPWYTLAAILGLTLNTAAYIAELFRAGMGTIAREHLDAAQSMGASWGIIFRTILIPSGLGAAFPAINSRLIHNFKNTALASFVAVPEFFNSITTAITRTFLALEFLIVAAIVYLILSASLSLGLQRLQTWFYRG